MGVAGLYATVSETHVVTVFLRNAGEVLLLKRSAEVGSYAGKWGAVAGHAEGSPDDLALEEIREETGIRDATLVRRGEAFEVHDEEHGTWVVHPYLFDCATRNVTTNYETVEHEWVAPTEILRRETVPDLWTSYDRVRPTVETVAGDDTHGSSYVSLRALEVLRDEAGLAAGRGDRDVAGVARDLLDARPSMRAVVNRVNRAMAGAEERTPEAVESSAAAVLADAVDADRRAAEAAADRVGERVLTLSRSETVRAALRAADPGAVFVAESRPAREGVGTAEALAEEAGVEVTLFVDAAVAHVLATASVDSVVVGADTVLADGRVVNKVGTRAAAVAAAREGVDCYAVTARDKIAPGGDPSLEPGDPADVYDGDADVAVLNPTFDVAPADAVTVVTEDGPMDVDAVAAAAEEYAAYADWDEG